jgi:UDP-N-acetylglucosamine transferase subunit ALG13
MIFVTVGTDSPFDRMMKIIDSWAEKTNRRDIFAQIGIRGWQPQHISFREFLEPSEFKQKLSEATLVIGHAGMGTILTALTQGKPVLVMPKLASLGEHRNEHQTATAKHLSKMSKVYAAYTEAELETQLDNLDTLTMESDIGPWASQELLARIRSFIHEAPIK